MEGFETNFHNDSRDMLGKFGGNLGENLGESGGELGGGCERRYFTSILHKKDVILH